MILAGKRLIKSAVDHCDRPARVLFSVLYISLRYPCRNHFAHPFYGSFWRKVPHLSLRKAKLRNHSVPKRPSLFGRQLGSFSSTSLSTIGKAIPSKD